MKKLMVMLMVMVMSMASISMATVYDAEANADNMIRGTSHRGNNHGVNTLSFAGIANGSEWVHAISNWALPGDLSGQTVTLATVTYELRDDYDDPAIVGDIAYVQGITHSWLEGTGWGNDDAQVSGSSWETYDGVNEWDSGPNGGDYDGVTYDSVEITALGQAITFDITALAQQWADGTLGAYGVKMAKSGGGAGYFAVSNREYEEGGAMLHLEYIPEPATMMLLGLGGLLIRRKKA